MAAREDLTDAEAIRQLTAARNEKQVARAQKFKAQMEHVKEFVVWAADFYSDQGKEVEMKLAVFCHHCGVVIQKQPLHTGDASHWLVCSYCNKNSCGAECAKGCWGAELLHCDAPVHEQKAVEATTRKAVADGEGTPSCEKMPDPDAPPMTKMQGAHGQLHTWRGDGCKPQGGARRELGGSEA